MVKKNLCDKPNDARKKAINPSPSGLRPTAHQPHQIRNPPLTKQGAKIITERHMEKSKGKQLS